MLLSTGTEGWAGKDKTKIFHGNVPCSGVPSAQHPPCSNDQTKVFHGMCPAQVFPSAHREGSEPCSGVGAHTEHLNFRICINPTVSEWELHKVHLAFLFPNEIPGSNWLYNSFIIPSTPPEFLCCNPQNSPCLCILLNKL